ncbi:MAG: GNAT family N-acetyltransferase [Bacteroidetes bacterium]|nr:GNAT family N-acetyltransferase [Bacteroidota bacterium]
MIPHFTIRPATEADASFIAWAVRTAEASGTEVISYQRLFGLSDAELDTLLLTLAAEEADGQELTYNTHRVVEVANRPVAACAAWIEAQDSPPSHLVRAQLLAYVLGNDRLQAAADKLRVLAEVAIARTPGALQLEAFGVLPEYRGQGFTAALIESHIRHYKAEHPGLALAEIILMSENTAAQRAYAKAGFHVVHHTHSDNPLLLTLLPGAGKVLMQRRLN